MKYAEANSFIGIKLTLETQIDQLWSIMGMLDLKFVWSA